MMPPFNYSIFQRLRSSVQILAFFGGLVLFLMNSSFAASSGINVTAELSRNRVAAGDVVQLDVKVTGAQQADLPPEIAADGLQIKLAGQSSQVQMINFVVTSSVLYSYIVVPLRSGNFTIPSINVRAEGKYFKTSPQQLTVVGAAPASSSNVAALPLSPTMQFPVSPPVQPSTRTNKPPERNKLGFAELMIPKKKFYVGEVIPVEIRFYVDAHYDFSTMGPPNFGGEGILTDRFKDPAQDRVERDGFLYNMAVFKTLISVVKPGEIDIAPASLKVIVAVPESMSAGMDADFFTRMLGGRSPFVREHRMELKTEPLHCDVMPLPQEGRPDDFSGAIGEFQLEGSASPHKAAQGDPITLTLQLSGKGNFQAIKAPQLTETKGWRTYPTADHFESVDALGWKGTKRFETTMIAQEVVTATPGALFSYFDPVMTKYITLTTKPLPVDITGADPRVTPSVVVPSPTPVVVHASPIVPIADQPLTKMTQQHWKDPLHRKEFVLAWLSLLFTSVMLAGALGLRHYRRQSVSLRDQEKRQIQQLLSELKNDELSAETFHNKAAECAELLIKYNASHAADLEEILRRRDEIKYGARESFLKAQERAKIIERLSL